MTHAFITVVIKVETGNVPAVDDWLDGFQGHLEAVKNADPSRLPLVWLRQTVHFMSMFTLPAEEGLAARLLIEANADGHPADVLADMVETMGGDHGPLAELVRRTGSWTSGPLLACMQQHCLEFKPLLTGAAGMMFTGTPGMTVRRITAEWSLSVTLRNLLERPDCPRGSALKMLRFARAQIFADVNWKWAFVCEPIPLLDDAKRSFSYSDLIPAAVRDLLWLPLGIALLLAAAWALGPPGWTWDLPILIKLLLALPAAVLIFMIELVFIGIVVLIGRKMLQRSEKNDVPIDREPDRAMVQEIMSRENQEGFVQNHLAAQSFVKKGWARKVALRLALWAIAELVRRRSQPGFLDRIGTIHFARWICLPGTDRLIFLSNFDGTWDSYLEDFIARLREGLTSIWSNTRDFPKTENLIEGGAADGARFKRWARRQQVPTRFWFCAYPHLTNSRIRINAAIRHGFASAADEIQAARWLSHFGYHAPEEVEKAELCPLVFGGLPAFRYSHCMLVSLRHHASARKWLDDLRPALSFGAHAQREPSAITIGFTSTGLRHLGLDDAALATFPTAFQDGMATPYRARLLGDRLPLDWLWGNQAPEVNVNAVMLIYASKAAELKLLINREKRRLQQFQQPAATDVPMRPLPLPDPLTKEVILREPFGFRDGISQPVMRGGPGWSKPGNELHVVEPGELVMGYRDNLGNLNPSPTSMGYDIGRNGTFLVIRQFEQDINAFNDAVSAIARTIDQRPEDARHPGFVDAGELEHWVASRMVGRWKDGSSLVRHPHPPARGKPRAPDNDYLFGREDPGGLRCPFGAHVRRANPRDSLQPGSAIELAISNRHRILRVGRRYRPKAGKNPGLLFMCINADIERQFEFLNQTWLLGRNFHGLEDEVDPILGYRGPDDSMTVPTASGPQRFAPLAQFVKVLGGGYFFMPGKRCIDVLAGR
ncbi:Dyp-type peroxidase [Piscinibacter sakaiensis]|uniref:Dyp-type peroxidase n=1 Tax=Piscinibacter sakaiensis TaxID=1547922 RepID=UPI003AB01D3B